MGIVNQDLGIWKLTRSLTAEARTPQTFGILLGSSIWILHPVSFNYLIWTGFKFLYTSLYNLIENAAQNTAHDGTSCVHRSQCSSFANHQSSLWFCLFPPLLGKEGTILINYAFVTFPFFSFCLQILSQFHFLFGKYFRENAVVKNGKLLLLRTVQPSQLLDALISIFLWYTYYIIIYPSIRKTMYHICVVCVKVIPDLTNDWISK